MGMVDLAILEPKHHQTYAGTAAANAVRLHGEVRSTGHAPLFYKWYSNLSASTRGVISTALDGAARLELGSHVITFTAKDQDDTGVPDTNLMSVYQLVTDSGMAGGPPPDAKSPCVIHVFLANMISPPGESLLPSLSKSSATLEAETPAQWADVNYQVNNRLRFRWNFAPSGAPAGRASADLILPDQGALVFVEATNDDVSKVRYVGALPAALGIGQYTVTLRVEDKTNPSVRDQVSRLVNITV